MIKSFRKLLNKYCSRKSYIIKNMINRLFSNNLSRKFLIICIIEIGKTLSIMENKKMKRILS